MLGTYTITADLAFAPYPWNESAGLRGILFDEGPATFGITVELAEYLVEQGMTPIHKEGHVTNGILYLVQNVCNYYLDRVIEVDEE